MMFENVTVCSADGSVRVRAERGSVSDTTAIVFEAAAIPGSLAIFAGTLTLQDLDILTATIFKSGRSVCDTFEVQSSERAIEREVLGRIAQQAADALSGRFALEAALLEHRRAHSPVDHATEVLVDADSTITTGFKIRAADRPGLLHDLASTLTRHGMRTRSISVLTIAGVARDTFRVVDGNGEAPADPLLLEATRCALLKAASA